MALELVVDGADKPTPIKMIGNSVSESIPAKGHRKNTEYAAGDPRSNVESGF